MIHTLFACACIALTCFLDILFIELLSMVNVRVLRSRPSSRDPQKVQSIRRMLRRLGPLRKSLKNEV